MTDNPILFGSQGTPITANGDSTDYQIKVPGAYAFDVTGTFDSATLTLYIKPGGHASYYALPGGAFTVAGGSTYRFCQGDSVKTTLSNGGLSTSLVATLSRTGV